MAFPATLDTFPGTAAQGTSPLTAPDHALDHRTLGSAAGLIETFLGTNSGTNIFKSYQAGWFPVPVVYNGAGQGTFQTVVAGGTLNNTTQGTPSLTNPSVSGGTFQSTIQNNGTINGGAYGTPTIGSIIVPGTTNALGFSAAIAPGVGTIADAASGTYTINAQAAQIYYSVMGTAAGNRTIGTIQNPSPYQQLTFAFKTSGSSNGTLVWGTVFRISQDYGTPALGTGVGWNYYNWRYNAIDSKFDFIGQMLDLI